MVIDIIKTILNYFKTIFRYWCIKFHMKESVNIPAKECCYNKDYIEAVKIVLAKPANTNF